MFNHGIKIPSPIIATFSTNQILTIYQESSAIVVTAQMETEPLVTAPMLLPLYTFCRMEDI